MAEDHSEAACRGLESKRLLHVELSASGLDNREEEFHVTAHWRDVDCTSWCHRSEVLEALCPSIETVFSESCLRIGILLTRNAGEAMMTQNDFRTAAQDLSQMAMPIAQLMHTTLQTYLADSSFTETATIHKTKTTKIVCGGSFNVFRENGSNTKKCGRKTVNLCKVRSFLSGIMRLRYLDGKTSATEFNCVPQQRSWTCRRSGRRP